MATLVGDVSVKASQVLILAAGMDSYSCYCVRVPLFETSGLPKIYKETKRVTSCMSLLKRDGKMHFKVFSCCQ